MSAEGSRGLVRALLASETASVPFRSTLEEAAQASLCGAPSPSPNYHHKRAHYGRAHLQAIPEDPPLPALLRSQFCSLTEGDLRGIEDAMRQRVKADDRNDEIARRVAAARAGRREGVDRAAARRWLQAERQAAAAGLVCERAIMAEYRKLCRW
ncbi:unnamed protein product [Phytomonas sp. Hart1]|nr:unnamed protein product [Phytomonas sp. Hart1]|eukprot:CCW72256.1 unnamed protein product [Phytomonas sp. isolate Hart1]